MKKLQSEYAEKERDFGSEKKKLEKFEKQLDEEAEELQAQLLEREDKIRKKKAAEERELQE